MKQIFFVLFMSTLLQTVRAQVNLQSGSAVFSLPIFTWDDNKSRLDATIRLDYSSHNGLLVDEVASNVGQGWSLIAGGVINRLQVGQPDDQKPREGNYDDLKKYPPGYLYNPTAISAGCPQAMANYPIFENSNVLYKQHNIVDADRELDYFSFQFNGRQGVFVLGKGNGDKGVVLGNNKLKIWFERDENMPNVRTTITAFNIQDENGAIYKFRDKGMTKLTKIHYCNINEYGYATPTGVPGFSTNNIYNQADFDELGMDENPFIVGSWYLSEVEDALTHRKINFTYTTLNINTPSGQSMQLIKPNAGTTDRYITIANKTTIAVKPSLSTIVYPDGHEVDLTYGDARKDVLGDVMLKSIKVKYQDRVVSDQELVQSYFMRNAIGIPATYADGLKARLCLVSVRRKGIDLKDQEPPYTFDYNLGTNATEDCVPPLFTPIKDIWGFYNGDTDGVPTDGSLSGYNQYTLLFFHPLPGTLPGNDQTLKCKPKAGYAKNGLLKKITFPMGGSLSYEYEQNAAPAAAGIGAYYGGVHVSKTKLNDGISTASDVLTTYSYVLADGTTTSIWGVETPICKIFPTTYFRPESPYVKFGVPPCDYKYKYAGILSRDEAFNPSDIQQFLAVFSQVMGYVGLAMDIMLLFSSSNPVFLIFDIVAGIADCMADSRYFWQHAVDYNFNLLSANLLPVQFKRVETKVGGSGTNNGRTIYEFTSPDDYAVIVPDISATFASKQRTAFWAYGLSRKITAQNAAGTTIRETENHYDFTKAKTALDPAHSSSCKCYVIKRSSRGSDTWTTDGYINAFTTTSITNTTSDPVVQDELIVDPYTMFTGRVELQSTSERYYKDNNNFLEKLTAYEYSPNNYQVSKITTTLTNGDRTVKEIYYTSDYTATGLLQTLTDKNIVGLPVATYNSIIKNSSSTPSYLNAAVTDFTTIGTGDIRPSRNLTAGSAQPQGPYTFDPANPFNYTGLVQSQIFTYDAEGNVTNMVDEAGRSITNLYDYNDKYLVASATNANAGDIAYTSFETDNGNGWTIHVPGGADPTYTTTASITGGRSLSLGSVTNLTTSVSISKPYVLSFWSDNASVTVSGSATLRKSAPQANGFTYYEYELAAGSASPTVSGSGNIDELRLYPLNARLITATYDPLLGKTSACDASGRIQLFEHDYLGRIRMVRDENRNIIKMYEYNYKQPQ